MQGFEQRQPIDSPIRYVDYLYVAVLVVWIVLSYSMLWGQISLHRALVSSDPTTRQIAIADFVHFYEAGQLAANNETRFHVFDPQVQDRWTQEFVKPNKLEKVFYLQYVPFIFPLMIPLAQLGAYPAFILWIVLSVAALAGGVLLLQKQCGATPGFTLVLLWAALCSVPCWNALIIGQLSCFLFLLFAVYIYALKRRRDVLAGCMLALSAAKPHYAIFAAIPALALKRTKVIVVAGIAELILMAAAAYDIGCKNIINYPAILSHSETAAEFAGLNPRQEACVRGLLSNVFSEPIAFALSIIFWLAALVSIGVIWMKLAKRPQSEQSQYLSSQPAMLMSLPGFWAVAFTVIAGLALSPHTNLYDWTLLLLPCALLTHLGWTPWNSPELAALLEPERALAATWLTIVFFYPVLSWAMLLLGNHTHSAAVAVLLISIVHYILLLLSAVILWRLLRTAPAKS